MSLDNTLYSIPENRDLNKTEVEVLEFLFKRERPDWLEKIKDLKVVARCGCRECPTILFSNEESDKFVIDYYGIGIDNNKIGVGIHGTSLLPTELEFYSIDGAAEKITIPKIETLKPTKNLTLT